MKKIITAIVVIFILTTVLAGCVQQVNDTPEVQKVASTTKPERTPAAPPISTPELAPNPTIEPTPELSPELDSEETSNMGWEYYSSNKDWGYDYIDNGDGTCTIMRFDDKNNSFNDGYITLEIPDKINGLSVNAIDKNAIFMCLAGSIKSFKVSSKNKYFSVKDGVLFNKDKSVLIRYPGVKKEKSYKIPNSVKTIGDCAFQYCWKLTGILIIPNSITTIREGAFESCDGITGVIISESVSAIGDGAFVNSSVTQIEFLGDAPEYFGSGMFDECSDDLKIIYDPAKSGWRTPEWNGYPCYPKK